MQLQKRERNQVIKAIADLGNRVMVPDVVAETGLSIDQAANALNTIASQTNAKLAVTSEGQIYYQFPPNLSYLYLAGRLKRALLVALRTVFALGFFLFRISFGLVLIFSLVVVFGVVLIFQSTVSVMFGASEAVGPMWADFFSLVRHLIVRSFMPRRLERTLGEGRDQVSTMKSSNFLLDCYSFLFGAGDPNRGLLEERWQLIAQVIRLNEGVVLAEHLSPYTGRGPDDEQALFAVLAKFGGMPEVSHSGHIIYVFPQMERRSEVTNYAFLPALIEEKPWTFADLSQESLRPVIAVATGNMLASIFCAWLLINRHSGSVPALFLFLTIYGLMFLIIPGVRFYWLRAKNQRIEVRNALARTYEQELGNPSPDLALRLQEAEKLRAMAERETAAKIVYSTDQDYLEQITDSDFLK